MASVTLKGVKKIYDGGVVAVQDFNLDIKDKEFVVFVGPSGCGKSTTLRMVAGLEDISEGTISIGDRVVNDVEPKDRDIAMVFQNYALYPHMSVYENMAFGLSLRRVPRNEIHEKVLEAAEILGITEYLGRTPKALSGGQRQRVAIGRAIVRNPQVFLMDEPLSNLDAKLRNQMRAEILLLHEKINTTFIYVTHDQTEAMTLGDRIVIMKDGFIQQVGTPQEVFDSPANLFVAGFIGSPQMNFFDATLSRRQGGYIVTVCGKELAVPEAVSSKFKSDITDGTEVVLGIRPEHMALADGYAPNAIKANIVVSEMMGSEVYLHAIPEGSDTAMVIRIPTLDLTAEQKRSISVHNDIYVSMREKAMHFFDRNTEESLVAGVSDT